MVSGEMGMKTVAVLRAYPKDASLGKVLAFLSRSYRVECFVWDRQGDYAPLVENANIVHRRCTIRAGYYDLATLLKLALFQIWLFVSLLFARFDAVHAMDLDTGFVGLCVAKLRRKPFVYHCLEHVRERIRNFYSKYATKADQESLKREVVEELRHKKLIPADGDIADALFNETILTIKKEAVYLHNLLPRIIAEKNIALREDFLENSGLDRFYVEELEREYYDLNQLNIEELYQIRKGLN